MMLVLPVSTARTSPASESTIATLVLLDRQRNVGTTLYWHGETLAVPFTESPG
jgi:hypothetical protein